MFKHDNVDDDEMDEHADVKDDNLEEHANLENDHANIAVINVNDNELIGTARNDNTVELRYEENDSIEIVNDVEIASETNDQAIVKMLVRL